MAAFAKPTYTATAYAAFRPTYAPNLYCHLLKYHSPTPTHTLLDLGTGPGTILPSLSPSFTKIHAVDPSPPMLTTAKKLLPPHLTPITTFHLSPAESLPFIPPSSISLTTAAQSAHWFNPQTLWPELARISLRPGGTVAFWGYKEAVFPEHPHATYVLLKYAYGEDSDEYLGKHWSQPGRSRIEGRLRAIRPPRDGRWERVERWEYEPRFTDEATKRTGLVWQDVVAPETEEEAQRVYGGEGIFGKLVYEGEGMLKREMTLGEVEAYVRTWSAVHSWKEAHPDRISLKDGGAGDVVDVCFEEMKEKEGWGEEWRDRKILVEWGHGMLFCKRTDKE